MYGSECDWKIHIRNLGYPFPLEIGGRKSIFFVRTSQLNDKLNGLYLSTKHDIDNRAKITPSENFMNFGPWKVGKNSGPIFNEINAARHSRKVGQDNPVHGIEASACALFSFALLCFVLFCFTWIMQMMPRFMDTVSRLILRGSHSRSPSAVTRFQRG